MVAWPAIVFAGICATGLVLSGFWAQRRFRQFDQLPAHFDASGRATRFASRQFVIWLTPVIFLILSGVVVALATMLPAEMGNGDPNVAVYLSSAIVLVAQCIVLWLLDRWAGNQG